MKTKTRFSILMIVLSFLFVSCEQANSIINPDDARSQYTGIWNVVENSTTFGTQYYDVEFFATSSDKTIINMANFFALGTWAEVEAELNNDLLVIPLQTVEGYKIYGQGSISSNQKSINFSFTVEEVATAKSVHSEVVTAVFTKQ
ncbi:MAG: hypothetical protein K9H64_12655 [Bacteroidales bacterium]|nr:hypothetical protein [Bacteroidales bacterium]MCF8456902.1 hypothetical protein [Bacteroidales bacterium]